jgi:hypothetical protein
MLVKNGFADVRRLGDLVHGRTVVPVGYEDFLGCVEELRAPLVTRKPGGPLPCGTRGILRFGG